MMLVEGVTVLFLASYLCDAKLVAPLDVAGAGQQIYIVGDDYIMDHIEV